jgi:hypothetical protein
VGVADGWSVSLRPSITRLKTVTNAVAIVHDACTTPA